MTADQLALDDPLYVAIAAALRDHGITQLAAIQAAVDAALDVLGRDRCIHDSRIHNDHHHTPVDGCPWCQASKEQP
ncbi:hypothetical protein [Streptomyces sp. NPDC093060]|uniref:hypothetical protein n=1 Tax=Streptomyces sp. NPDC093060 TaxID=3366019 RepID=UPI0037F2405F